MPESNISILHIASDEKFIDAANYIFDKAFPGCNHFMIPKSRYNRKLIYIKTTKNLEIVPYDRNMVSYLSGKTRDYDCVFLHGITELNSTVFLSSPDKNKFIGILWGAELYTEDNFPDGGLLGELTEAINLNETEISVKETIKKIIRKLIYIKSLMVNDATKLAALSLQYFCMPFDEEFDFFVKHRLISKDCKNILFTYYPLQFLLKGHQSATINGNDILVGNSASSSNNHLEAFEIIKNINPSGRKIVVPLSYGSDSYADYIELKGFSLFKDNFKSLRKFMPLDLYTEELKSCGIVLMNHFRQQAFGNILAMLYLGSKVYLNESNTIFSYFKRIGIKVFSIEKEFNCDNPDALTNLSIDEIQQNRSILEMEIGEEIVIERLKKGIGKYFNYWQKN